MPTTTNGGDCLMPMSWETHFQMEEEAALGQFFDEIISRLRNVDYEIDNLGEATRLILPNILQQKLEVIAQHITKAAQIRPPFPYRGFLFFAIEELRSLASQYSLPELRKIGNDLADL